MPSKAWARLWALYFLTGSSLAYAEGAGKRGSAAAAEQTMEQGVSALAAKDYALALSTLTQAYRTYQNPRVLFHLGALAVAEQRTVDAQDLLQRFLADTTVDPADPLQEQARKLLATLPGRPRGFSPDGRHAIAYSTHLCEQRCFGRAVVLGSSAA